MDTRSGGSIDFNRSLKKRALSDDDSDYKIPNPEQDFAAMKASVQARQASRSEEHTSELQSHSDLVCRLLLEKKKKKNNLKKKKKKPS